MRVDVTCSCGASLALQYERGRSQWSTEAAHVDRLLSEFRRDHKTCRVNAAAVLAARETQGEGTVT